MFLLLGLILVLNLSIFSRRVSANTSILDEWHETWGSSDVEDHLKAISIDSSDNIYLAGETVRFPYDLEKRNSMVNLIKYNSSGGLQWNRTWGGSKYDLCEAQILDSENNIYLTGFTNSFGTPDTDIFLLKFDDSGSLEWNQTYGKGIEVRSNAIALDSSNNIYIAGDRIDFNVSSYLDCLLIKIDSLGNHTILWNRTWGGTGTDTYFAMAIDSSNNIYLSGYTKSFGEGDTDIIIVKYDSSGQIKWNRTWGGTGQDIAYTIALDSSDDIYVAGKTKSFGEGMSDMVLVKYDGSGVQQWNRTWGGTGVEFSTSCVFDSKDSIYLVGSTGSFGAMYLDMCVVKFDSSGTEEWNRIWSGADDDYGYAIALDSSENIYIGGSQKNWSEAENDMFFIKFSGSVLIIPSYDLIFLIGITFAASVILIRKRYKLTRKK